MLKIILYRPWYQFCIHKTKICPLVSPVRLPDVRNLRILSVPLAKEIRLAVQVVEQALDRGGNVVTFHEDGVHHGVQHFT